MKTLFEKWGIHPVVVKIVLLIICGWFAFSKFDLTHSAKFEWFSIILAVGTFVSVRFLVKDKITSWTTSVCWGLLSLGILLKMSAFEFYLTIPDTKKSFMYAAILVVLLNVIAAKVSDYLGIAKHETPIYEEQKRRLGYNNPKYIGALALLLIIIVYATRH